MMEIKYQSFKFKIMLVYFSSLEQQNIVKLCRFQKIIELLTFREGWVLSLFLLACYYK